MDNIFFTLRQFFLCRIKKIYKEICMNSLIPSIITIIAGLAILIFPRLLSYIVAFYLIIVGVLELVTRLS